MTVDSTKASMGEMIIHCEDIIRSILTRVMEFYPPMLVSFGEELKIRMDNVIIDVMSNANKTVSSIKKEKIIVISDDDNSKRKIKSESMQMKKVDPPIILLDDDDHVGQTKITNRCVQDQTICKTRANYVEDIQTIVLDEVDCNYKRPLPEIVENINKAQPSVSSDDTEGRRVNPDVQCIQDLTSKDKIIVEETEETINRTNTTLRYTYNFNQIEVKKEILEGAVNNGTSPTINEVVKKCQVTSPLDQDTVPSTTKSTRLASSIPASVDNSNVMDLEELFKSRMDQEIPVLPTIFEEEYDEDADIMFQNGKNVSSYDTIVNMGDNNGTNMISNYTKTVSTPTKSTQQVINNKICPSITEHTIHEEAPKVISVIGKNVNNKSVNRRVIFAETPISRKRKASDNIANDYRFQKFKKSKGSVRKSSARFKGFNGFSTRERESARFDYEKYRRIIDANF